MANSIGMGHSWTKCISSLISTVSQTIPIISLPQRTPLHFPCSLHHEMLLAQLCMRLSVPVLYV